MGLLDDFEAAAAPKKQPCKLCVWLDDQDEKVRHWIESDDLGPSTVEKVLRGNGIFVSHHTVSRHRSVCCGTR